MQDRPIITSLLDLDWYKLTMLQWIWKYFPDLRVKMAFKNRTTSVHLAKFIDIGDLIDQLEAVRALQLKGDEFEYLYQQGTFQWDFLTYFNDHSLADYEVWSDGEQVHFEVDDKWLNATLWETFFLSISNQMYCDSLRNRDGTILSEVWAEGDRRLNEKTRILRMCPGIQFIEFGTRRRYSGPWQQAVLINLLAKAGTNLLGTSNVFLAKQLDIKPVGTFAHELYMALYGVYYGSGCGPAFSSHLNTLNLWWKMYGQALSIALTDTYTTDFFFENFKPYAADWRGLRHDSGSPIEFGEKAIAFYEQLGIDPRSKTLVFSDGLDVEKIVQIHQRFANRIMTTFGWGTNLTNDLGPAPLSLVMKVIESNGHPVVKLSDNPEKATGDLAEIERCKRMVGYNPANYQAEACKY